MASAKLLLKTGKGDVVTVDESILDRGAVPHGVTIGIPSPRPGFPPRPRRAPRSARRSANAPARAAGPCEGRVRPGLTRHGQDRRKQAEAGGGELLYVVGPDKTRYIVDASGTSYEVDKNDELLLRTLVGSGREPQRVSKEWLETLIRATPSPFPKVEGQIGTAAGVPGGLPPRRTRSAWCSRRPTARASSTTSSSGARWLPSRTSPPNCF